MPHPGARPDPAAAADASWPGRAAQPRLYPARDAVAVRGPRRGDGKVIGKCFPRHCGSEFLKFLREIEGNVPEDLDVHLVMDNYATRKTSAIRRWLARHPRWHVHFTPTSASWINQVERFFADLTDEQIRRGVHRSTHDLECAIRDYIKTVNDNPRPFRWTKSADDMTIS